VDEVKAKRVEQSGVELCNVIPANVITSRHRCRHANRWYDTTTPLLDHNSSETVSKWELAWISGMSVVSIANFVCFRDHIESTSDNF